MSGDDVALDIQKLIDSLAVEVKSGAIIDRAYKFARSQGKNQPESIAQVALVVGVTEEEVCDYLIEKTKAPGELI